MTKQAERSPWIKPLWNVAGTLFLGLGMLGIPLPVLPTTPFLLLAAACYLRGSRRMHAWMMTNAYFGTYLSDYRAGRGIPWRTKVSAIALLWIGIGLSAFGFVEDWNVRAVLLLVAVAVTTHIVMLKTKASSPERLPD